MSWLHKDSSKIPRFVAGWNGRRTGLDDADFDSFKRKSLDLWSRQMP